ncbi:RagB/SusD family nutrient uptake outer membrane protein [Flavitalea sp. BT771]|uniref:RagB/SusD family nutrient uptake outer membrane protein n=1 Tax=Flavitalea sp. BT771 TaxID=3063329 RepID=UPI0026E223E8|nr:RagB/SusD family nutrient uptake outer membrane protein [Flavitalea sp. BT771]MDO6433057.1 RagB/SusD family nutrient uptake outer membrane protein [Flavitalea sp. BT771]MDV6221667.1 RagB/SusD family nutrient uptake outer membrane protein [Flavitalea sp. BT771]
MISIHNNIKLSLLFLFIFQGCRKFVTVDPPITKLISTSVFASDASATSAQLAVYASMINESYNMAFNCGLLSDELKNYSNNPQQKRVYINNLDAITQERTGPWIRAYNYIYNENALIEGLRSTEGVSNAAKLQLQGEAKFIRAFWNFYLVNCYGDVPLVTSTDYKINSTMRRISKTDVYKQIVADLTDAASTLNSQFVDLTDSMSTDERVRPTKAAAQALLARVYLYLGKYEQAEALASAVINNSDVFQLLNDLNLVFLKNSAEAIWQLQIPLPSGYNTPDGTRFILNSAPQSVSISSTLLDSFEQGDLRRSLWVRDTVFSGKTYSYAYKYKVFSSSDISEYVMMLRLGEQFLIRAEARAEQGNLTGSNSAQSDLDTIRKRAGLPVYSGAIDRSSLLNAILHERKVELFTEWGHRWFDLIRAEKINDVMGKVTPLKGGVWNSDGHQALFPIPRSEIIKDYNLLQNPGYQ